MTSELTELNRQALHAARQNMNVFAWPTVLLTLIVLVGYIANLAFYTLGVIPVWLALPVLAALTHLAYTPVHEAVHGNICGAHNQLKWLNQLCGYIGAQIAGNPFSSHRFEHLTHHRHINDPDKDPDYVVKGVNASPFVAFWVMLKFASAQINYFPKHHWAKATTAQKRRYCIELLCMFGWRIAVLALIPGPEIFLVLIGGGLLGGSFTVYWFSYRPHHPFDQTDRYRNTSSLIMPVWMKPVEWFWLGQHLHSIHHLFPRVPFYRYSALHREIEPVLRAHGTPIVGIFSRESVESASSV